MADLTAQGQGDYLGVRSRLAELEMELAALKRGSDAPSREKDLAAALAAQTKALTEALKAKPNQTSVTAVKTYVNWPTFTDDRSEARDVVQFYGEFEDCCSVGNNCKGMNELQGDAHRLEVALSRESSQNVHKHLSGRLEERRSDKRSGEGLQLDLGEALSLRRG